MLIQANILQFFIVAVLAGNSQRRSAWFQKEDAKGYVMSELNTKSEIQCAMFCSRIKRCGGIRFNNPKCKLVGSTHSGSTGTQALSTSKFYQIKQIHFNNFKSGGWSNVPIVWPISPNGYGLVRSTLTSADCSNRHIPLVRARYPDAVYHVTGFKYQNGKCYNSYNFGKSPQKLTEFSCPNIKSDTTAITFEIEFPDSTTSVVTVNGYRGAQQAFNTNFDFDRFSISSCYSVDTIDIKYY